MTEKPTRTRISLVYKYFEVVVGQKTEDKSKGHKRRKQQNDNKNEGEDQPPTKKTICKLLRTINTSHGKDEVQCKTEFVVSYYFYLKRKKKAIQFYGALAKPRNSKPRSGF